MCFPSNAAVYRDTVTNPFSDVRSFGFLCDEANDVANKEQLITFVKFLNPTATAVEEWLAKPRRKLPRFLQEMFNKLYSFKMPVLKWALRVRILKEYGGLPKL